MLPNIGSFCTTSATSVTGATSSTTALLHVVANLTTYMWRRCAIACNANEIDGHDVGVVTGSKP